MARDIQQPADTVQVQRENPSSISFSDVMGSDSQSKSALQQMQDGVAESLTDWQGQARRAVATGALGYWAGRLADYEPFGRAAIPAMLAATGVTALDHWMFSKNHNDYAVAHHDGAIEGMTKFGADVLSAAGVGFLFGRKGWADAGKEHVDYIVDTKNDARFVRSYRGGRGPKIFIVPDHTRYTPIALDTKLDRLDNFLKARRETDKFASLSERVRDAHEEMWKLKE